MIEVQGLCKSFGDVQAVKQLSFSARDGAVTGLLGPNGAGKTTTLRMLYSLLPPDDGQILIDGDPLSANDPDMRRRLGVVPDAKGLYQRLTARENIRYFGELHGMPSALLDSRIEELAATLDMQGFIDRRVLGFSHGQRVKVAIARALVHQPRNVLLDEPSDGLDVMSTRALRAFISQMREHGCCVVFSSHIMQEIAALCDHIVIVANGSLIAQGAAQELMALAQKRTLEDAFVHIIGAGTAGLLG